MPRSRTIQYKPFGDNAVLIEFKQVISPGILLKVTAFDRLIQQKKIKGIIETVPAYASLAVYYDQEIFNFYDLLVVLTALEKSLGSIPKPEKMVWEVPICYDEEFAIDLGKVAKHSKLSKEAVIEIHSSQTYLVYMLGFLPGLIYLGGMDKRISCSRKAKPRLKIAAGSVAIGGIQTGLYSIDSPGGWNIIGRTPVSFFNPKNKQKFIVKQGEYVQFKMISKKEFRKYKSKKLKKLKIA